MLAWLLPSASLFAQIVREAPRPSTGLPIPANPANPANPAAGAIGPQAAQASQFGAPAAAQPSGQEAELVQPGEQLPAPENQDASAAAAPVASLLQLSDVIASVYSAYPSIEKARLERTLARGELVEAFGAYDTKLEGYSLNEPIGFYQNYRNGLGVARQTWWGGYLSAGYRLGRGSFPSWYKERETNESGQFSIGAGMPLLQGRAIDPQRVAVFQASLAEGAADPLLQAALLAISRDAAVVYWDWLAVGAVLEAQRELLSLATLRGEQFKIGVQAEAFAEVNLIFNDQLIAEREGKVLETEQKFRETSFKLALYLRNEAGAPLIPEDAWLPKMFPEITPLPVRDFATDLNDAVARRPEVRLIQFSQRQVQLDQQLARNQLLPTLNLMAEASQDTGLPTSRSNDKGEFELMVGVQGEVPIQRRKARGKIQSTGAKIGQLDQELRLQQDRIGAELQTAYNALAISEQVVRQGELAVKAAVETLKRFRIGFVEGKVDLIYINLLESKVNESQIKLLEARRNWYVALAAMQTALGLDPLDQAMLININP